MRRQARRWEMSCLTIAFFAAAASPRASSGLSQEVFQDRHVEMGVGQKALQPGVLAFQRLQLAGVGYAHAAVLGLPLVERGVAHAVRSKNPMICFSVDRALRIVLLQVTDSHHKRGVVGAQVRGARV
jgi:hypothetical protein